MFCRRRIAAGLAALGIGFVPAIGAAGDCEHEHAHAPSHLHLHFHSRPKSTLATPHTHQQAGYPQEIGAMAQPSYNEHYSGGYVGGGIGGHGGHERCANQGTWGWDYTPYRPMSSRIFLNYSHGRHYQGGTRGYATDGPKPLEHITESIHEHMGGKE